MTTDNDPIARLATLCEGGDLRFVYVVGVARSNSTVVCKVLGGKASVARLRRVKPEASALIHDYVTETYYIMSGSGTFVTGGSLGGAKPMDLSNVNAGMSQSGTRIGGESRRCVGFCARFTSLGTDLH